MPDEIFLPVWFGNGAQIALVGGKAQCLDFDDPSLFPEFCNRANQTGLAPIIDRLICQETPSGGHHLVWCCEDTSLRNMKLAERENREVLIETRGKGGYFLISPSKGYNLLFSDWKNVPTITVEEREALIELARSFNERVPGTREVTGPIDGGESPGDDYDKRGDIESLLMKHGWVKVGKVHWRRPGKTKGISASFGHIPNRFWVFSTSTQFDPEHLYKPWHVYAVLEHEGDWKAAAIELRKQGFGKAPESPVRDFTSKERDQVGPSAEVGPTIEQVDSENKENEFRKFLFSRLYDPSKRPPPMRKIFQLNNTVICTPGNLTAITAQAKTGKSAFCAAMMAATMYHPDADSDCLGVFGPNYEKKALIYIDTEQSPEDFWFLVTRAMDRAKNTTPPEWLYAFCLAGLNPRECRKSLTLLLDELAEKHHGIQAVIIDGVADLVPSVNQEDECNSLVAELHGLAIKYDCPIIGVIHMNPKSERGNFDKVRGHLGSQLERKAETNLKLEKDGEVTVIWSQKQRKAPIHKEAGPRFAWDNELKMHVSVEAHNFMDPKIEVLQQLVDELFEENPQFRFMELARAISRARDISIPTAKRKIKDMISKKMIHLEGGFYLKND